MAIFVGYCWNHLPISLRMTSSALEQSYGNGGASDVTLKDVGKMVGTKPWQNTTRHGPRVYLRRLFGGHFKL